MSIQEQISEQEFDALCETHEVLAGGTNIGTGSTVTVIGNSNGTPVAMRYSSIESDYNYKCYRLNLVPVQPVTLEHKS